MGLKVKDPNGEWRSTGGGGGKSNLLVVTLKTENGEYVSSHTYQEIKEFCDNDGDAVLCVEGTIAGFYPLSFVSDTQVCFGKQGFAERLYITQLYYINADGTVTFDQQIGEIGGASITVDDALSPDSTNPVQNKVIFAYLEEATNVLGQIQGSIPSDDHINGLIDEYLSEALGGDY